MANKKHLSSAQQAELLGLLEARFQQHPQRHKGVDWARVHARLQEDGASLWSLHQMESTGGEPDVVGDEQRGGGYLFIDCSAESPKGRRSVCYDHPALMARKEHKPKDSAVHMASEMGIELLTEEQYRQLQQVGEFDTKTSSWVQTPEDVRKLGGAVFCDRRYGRVFTYHNGADSYYAARGFRGMVKV